jgi:hypothetical protein
MMMNRDVVLVIFMTFMILNEAYAVVLNCSLVEYSQDYGCETADKFLFDDEINSVKQTGNSSKKINQIAFFEIPYRSETEFIPLKICEEFRQLQSIIVKGTKVKTINKNVFNSCHSVTDVLIQYTKVSALSVYTFSDLINLKRLSISFNRIKHLSATLLAKNRNLKYFESRGNQIEFIDLQFYNEIEFVDLRDNICINQKLSNETDYFGADFNVYELNEKILQQCNNILKEKTFQYHVSSTIKECLITIHQNIKCCGFLSFVKIYRCCRCFVIVLRK